MKTFLKNLESTERPYLGPNYWLMRRINLILPETKWHKVVFIMLHEFLALFAISEFMEIYLIWTDLNLVITNLKVSMLTFVCVVKVHTFIIWQKYWRELVDYVTEADKLERMNEDPIKVAVVNAYTKYSRRLTYFYWLLIFMTFLVVTMPPLVIYVSSPTFRQNLRNETVDFPPIFIAYVPFNKNKSPGCWFTFIWHFLMCCNGASVMAAYDTFVVVIMVFLGGKLDLLRIRCKQLLEGLNRDEISDEEWLEAVRQIHRTHIILIKYWRLFNSMISPVMFLYVIVWAVMICSSAFQLSLTIHTGEKLLMIEYLVFGIAQLFMFCWHSNEVMGKNRDLSFGLYESKWWTANYKQRKIVLILFGQLSVKNVFTAGPFADLTLSTFVNILKGAYSYYALLRN